MEITSTFASSNASMRSNTSVRHADRRAAEQTPLGILGGIRVLRGLLNVLDGNQPAQHTVFIHNRQLLDAVLRQNLLCLLKRRADGAVMRFSLVMTSLILRL